MSGTKALLLGLLFAGFAAAACSPQPDRTVTLWLTNTNVADNMVLALARGVVTRTFNDLEVYVRWRLGKPDASARCGRNIEITFDTDVPTSFDEAILGMRRSVRRTPPFTCFMFGHPGDSCDPFCRKCWAT